MTTSNPSHSSGEHSPFMKLPPEIRLMIYELAVHEYIATAMSKTLTAGRYKLNRQCYLGAPALIHTTSLIRKESRNAMLAITHREWEVICTRYDSLFEANLEADLGFDDSWLRQYLTAGTLLDDISDLCFALDEEYICSYRVPKTKDYLSPNRKHKL